MSDDKPTIAHLLRRSGFGPHPGQVEALLPLGYAGALAAVLAAPPLRPEAPAFGTKDDGRVLVSWWLKVMSDPLAGLHEKMVWFWHGHLTSSLDKAEPVSVWRQHQLLRSHALGNLRTLLQEITVDAAMLGWLDGDGSQAEAPNENYARELMELFALGRDSARTPRPTCAPGRRHSLGSRWTASRGRRCRSRRSTLWHRLCRSSADR